MDENTEVSLEQSTEQVVSNDTLLTQQEDQSLQVPSKFLVDGKPDYTKLTQSYIELEKRIGSKVPVSDANEYEYAFQDENNWDQERLAEFKQQAVEMGMSKDQFKSALGLYEKNISEVIDQYVQTPEKAETQLKDAWGTEYDANMKSAQKAFKAFVPADIDVFRIGNNPDVIQILAAIGKQMGEDKGPGLDKSQNADTTMSKLEIEDLMKRPDYWQNQEVQRIVSSWYNR
jgi:hypothetical protein